jgi:hypothetical protein
MTELTREHDDLPPVVSFVCHEVRQDMWDVERQVAPHVRLGRRHLSSRRKAELEERFDSLAAPLESRQQLMARNLAAVNRGRDRDPVFLAEGLEPHASRVVHVPGDHADRALGRSGYRNIPEGSRQVLHEVRGDAAVGPPCRQKRRTWACGAGHASNLLSNHASHACISAAAMIASVIFGS